jgi:DNA-binding protein YbaB
MTSPYEKTMNDALAAYQQQREQLTQAREKLNTVTNSVTSPRQVVTATVGRHGEVIGLAFPTSAYKRMAPAELASVIIKTIQEAREKSLSQSADLLKPMLPKGFSAEDMLSGKTDVQTMLSRMAGPEFERRSHE